MNAVARGAHARVEPGCCPLCGPEASRTRVGAGVDFEYRVTGDQEFQVNGCGGCGTWFLDPRPADDEIARLYPADYEPHRFDELPWPVRMGRRVVQSRKAAFVEGLHAGAGTLVDVGAGNGQLLRALRRRAPDRWRLVAWDFPGPALERLAAEGFATVAGPIVPELAPRNVDVAVMLQVIEHLARPREALEALATSVRPGGHLLIETPCVDGLDARWFKERYWGGFHFPRHLVLFRLPSLAALLSACGFEVIGTRYLASPAFWLQSLHHWASERPAVAWARNLASLRNPFAVAGVTAAELVLALFHPTSNVRVLARRR